ncbi:MAG: hypothetical protein EBU90_21800, partial [Proteobacteria bacterium]|nr:hypothetical protein [Pseudomonadota bacterium]
EVSIYHELFREQLVTKIDDLPSLEEEEFTVENRFNHNIEKIDATTVEHTVFDKKTKMFYKFVL